MEYCLSGTFSSLTKRILYAYPAAYPKFLPVTCEADEASQRDFHGFLLSVLQKFYETPELFTFPDYPDEYYGPWQLANTNPELMEKMEKIESRFTGLIATLIKVGQNGEPNRDGMFVPKASKAVNKNTAELLVKLSLNVTAEKDGTQLSLPNYPRSFVAWKSYALQNNEKATKVDQAVTFIYAKYFGRVYSAADFFGKFIEEEDALTELEDFYRENGYACGNSLLNGKTRYACTKWQKEYKNGQKSSFSISFNPRIKDQLKVEFHLPSFREALEKNFESLEPSLKSFVYSRLNNCSACGYCTQTDKTGTRPRLAREMEFADKKELKCPLFPNFTFQTISAEDITKMKLLCQMAENITLA